MARWASWVVESWPYYSCPGVAAPESGARLMARGLRYDPRARTRPFRQDPAWAHTRSSRRSAVLDLVRCAPGASGDALLPIGAIRARCPAPAKEGRGPPHDPIEERHID